MTKRDCGCEIRRSLPHIQGTEDLSYLVFCRLHEVAPELLEACKQIAELLPHPLEATRIGEILKPVIAKAEGREKREMTEGRS